MKALQEAGVTHVLSRSVLGKVLSGFVKRLIKSVQFANVEDQASLQEF